MHELQIGEGKLRVVEYIRFKILKKKKKEKNLKIGRVNKSHQ